MKNQTNETYRISGVRVADPAIIASPRSVELTPQDQGTIAVWIDPTRFKGKKTFAVWVHFSEPREEQVLLELTATNDPGAAPRRSPAERLRDMEKQMKQLLQDMEALRRDLRSEPEKPAPAARIDRQEKEGTSVGAGDPDRDGDGLSDFQEAHKYFTNPDKRDSDGDGKPDGDWDERREYAYSIRTVIRVMLPINEREIVNDDYQDARVLARNDRYAELEVIHYPLNTVKAGIRANPNWKDDVRALHEYVQPGLSTNWDEEMREQLLKDLAADGIHVDKLNDREVVQQVSAWLLKRVKSGRYFNIFHVHFPDGKARPYPGQENQRQVSDNRRDIAAAVPARLRR